MIERREGVRGGRPVIEGTRVGVVQIHQLVEEEGIDIATVVDGYGGTLTSREVEAALEYYHDHRDEMEQYRREAEQAFEEAAGDALADED